MLNLVFRAAFFARLFGGATSDRYTLVDGSFQRTSEGDVTTVCHPPLRFSPIVLRRGAIWSAIAIDTAEGPIEMRGLPHSAALEWHAALLAWQRPVRERRAVELMVPVKAALELATSPFSNERFVRRSELDALLAGCMVERSATEAAEFDAVATLAEARTGAATAWERSNEGFITRALEQHGTLFATLEKSPLTGAQRRACVIDDDYNLVVAGAGTGKTSVMIGRAAYLIASKTATAPQILLVAFNRKAAEELRERVIAVREAGLEADTLTIRTFHALGKEIIAEVEGAQPSVSVLAEDEHAFHRFISQTLEELLETPAYAAAFIRYGFQQGQPYQTMFEFDNRADYEKYVAGLELRTLSGHLVKSYEELRIANFLLEQGIAFEYERAFEHDTATREQRQYQPDFTISLPAIENPGEAGAAPKVVYLEHFALNADGSAPSWFPGYVDGVAWKRKLHAECGTILVETQSHEFRSGLLPDALGDRLARVGVRARPRTDHECLTILRQAGVVLEAAEAFAKFIRLARELGVRHTIAATLDTLVGDDRVRTELLWGLLEPVLSRYEAELASRRELDFPEMIHRATRYVREEQYRSPFTRILVDEFQDISEARADLMRALKAATAGATLFCVGDDWQSIYRFIGSDVRFVSAFESRIGLGSRTDLDRTFRFNDRIGEAATTFVRRNPAQTQRRLVSMRTVDKPAISLIPTSEPLRGVTTVLNRVATFAERRQTDFDVLLLARYRFELNPIREGLESIAAQTWPRIRIRFATVHESKGTEADIVVLVGLQSGRNGFPAEKPLDPFEEAFLPPREPYPSAEERRLFYVALTRARHRVYLVYDRYRCSTFVDELAAIPGSTDRNELSDSFIQSNKPRVPCPRCTIGWVVERSAGADRFYACSRFPACSYTERGCGACGGLLLRVDGHRVCSTQGCTGVHLECRRCGSPMEIRNSRHGQFFGCSKYGRLDPLEQCSETEQLRQLPSADVLRSKHARTAISL